MKKSGIFIIGRDLIFENHGNYIKFDGEEYISQDLVDEIKKSTNQQISFKRKTTLQRGLIYINCILSAFLVGFNSIGPSVLPNQHSLFFNVNQINTINEFYKCWSLALICLGTTLGGIILFSLRQYKHLNIYRIVTVLYIINYLLLFIYPHVIIMILTRVYLGIGNGMVCLLVPQTLYSLANHNRRSLIVSLYSIFVRIGHISGVYLATISSEYRLYLDILPIFLSFIIFLTYYKTGDLKRVIKKDSLVETCRFLISDSARYTLITISFLHLFHRSIGIIMLGDFLTIFFDKGVQLIHRLGISIISNIFTLVSSYAVDRCGRKVILIVCFSGLFLITLLMWVYQTDYVLFYLFAFCFNSGFNSIPHFYQIEIVKKGYEATISEVGSIISWLLALFFAILIELLKRRGPNIVIYIACISSLVGLFVLAGFMIETKGITSKNKDFIQKFKNHKNWTMKKK